VEEGGGKRQGIMRRRDLGCVLVMSLGWERGERERESVCVCQDSLA
jgi:hypothetical protein